MENFLISLSHPCMYGRGNVRVVELRTRSVLAWSCKRNGPRFFMKVDQRGYKWLMHVVVIASIKCRDFTSCLVMAT